MLSNGLFLLKLTDQLESVNATIYNDYTITYLNGSDFSTNYCSDFMGFVPELIENESVFKYRIGISVNQPGDYCIVNAFDGYFNFEQENNSEIFLPYDSLENTIKFNSCGSLYIRDGTQGYYFFSVN